jgi:hypothetical protein
MIRSRLTPFVLGLLAFVAVTGAAQAGWWKKFVNAVTGKPPEYTTVIVTKNYIKSVMLAELIQHETGQPILLLPTGGEGESIYAMGPGGQAGKFDRAKFLDVLEILSPKTVVFLGDERFAPKEYQDLARKLYPVCVLDAPDFDKVAEAAGAVMQLEDLADSYKDMIKQFDSKGNIKAPPRVLWEELSARAAAAQPRPATPAANATPAAPTSAVPLPITSTPIK